MSYAHISSKTTLCWNFSLELLFSLTVHLIFIYFRYFARYRDVRLDSQSLMIIKPNILNIHFSLTQKNKSRKQNSIRYLSNSSIFWTLYRICFFNKFSVKSMSWVLYNLCCFISSVRIRISNSDEKKR